MIRGRSYGGRRLSESSKSGRCRCLNKKFCPAFPRYTPSSKKSEEDTRSGANTAIPTGAVNPIAELYQQPRLPSQSSAPRDDSRQKSSAKRATPRQSIPKPGPSNRRLSSSKKFGSPLAEKSDFDRDIFDDKEISYEAECSFMYYHPSLLRNEYNRSPQRSSEDYPEFGACRTQDMDEDDVIPVTDLVGSDNSNFSPVVPSRKPFQNSRTSQCEIRFASRSVMKVMEESCNRSRNDSLSPYFAPRITSTPALQPQGPIPRSYLGKNVPDKEIYHQEFQPEQLVYDKTFDDNDDDSWTDFQVSAENVGPSAGKNVQTIQRRSNNVENNRNWRQSVDNVDRSPCRMPLLKTPSPKKRTCDEIYEKNARSAAINRTLEKCASFRWRPLTDDEN